MIEPDIQIIGKPWIDDLTKEIWVKILIHTSDNELIEGMRNIPAYVKERGEENLLAYVNNLCIKCGQEVGLSYNKKGLCKPCCRKSTQHNRFDKKRVIQLLFEDALYNNSDNKRVYEDILLLKEVIKNVENKFAIKQTIARSK